MKEFFSQSYIAQLIGRYVREKRDNELEQALLRVLIGLVLIYYFRKSGFYLLAEGTATNLNLVFVPSVFRYFPLLLA